MEPLAVERSVWIAATRERVWRAITDANQINQWWGGDDHWEIPALQVGATITFGHGDDRMIATLAVVDPPRQLTINWPPQPQYHAVAMSTSYRLDEEEGGTRVVVIETGFEALPDDIRAQRFDSTAQGYETVLADLKAYVERTNA
jgi:uncharacterized protein YndB with AHSA1/START domain